jgi:hypothetical protein
MKKPAEYAAVAKAVRAAQHYDVADFVDLCDFCEQVRRRTTVAKLKTACADTIAAVHDAKHGLVRAERHKGTAVAGRGASASTSRAATPRSPTIGWRSRSRRTGTSSWPCCEAGPHGIGLID